MVLLMNSIKWVLVFGIVALLVISPVLAGSKDVFGDLISKNSKNDIDKVLFMGSSLKAPEISSETKENAVREVLDKFESMKTVPIIVWVKDGESVEDVVNSLEEFEVKYIYNEFNGFSGRATEKSVNDMIKDDKIDYFAFDNIVVANLLQSRPLIGASAVHSNYSLTGEGVGVCHLDTGVNYNHPSLAGAYSGGYDFVNNDSDPFDDNGHGTSTAGIIASNHTLFRGISPGVDLLAVKVLGADGQGYFSDVIAGINWCITNRNTYKISSLSMSLGTVQTYNPQTSPGYAEPALQTAFNLHIVPVASTGNMGSVTGISYPAVSPYVISVASSYNSNLGTLTFNSNNFSCTDTNIVPDMISCFSNRASFTDIIAPGSSIATTSISGTIAPRAGTSMSVPHIVGTIALMKQRNFQMTVPQVEDILKFTGRNIYDSATGINFSRVNALDAVNYVPHMIRNGSFVPGGSVNLYINDARNPGAVYFVFLSFGRTFGIPLANGLVFPLDLDGLLTFSLTYPNPLVTNNIGFLDSNGRAVATVNVPNIPGIENITLYSAFLSANSTDITSMSNSVRV